MYIWGKGRAAGRVGVRLFVGNRGLDRVGSTFRRVGSGQVQEKFIFIFILFIVANMTEMMNDIYPIYSPY